MKRILYFNPSTRLAAHVAGCLSHCPDLTAETTAFGERLRSTSVDVEWVHVADAKSALAFLEEHYVNLLVIDLRRPDSCSADDFERRLNAGLGLLDALDHPADLEQRYGFHRIVVLVGGADDEQVDQLMVAMGARGVGRVIRQRPSSAIGKDESFARGVFDESMALVANRRVGKRALAASGGGITGIYFELGALKCLDDVLSSGIEGFDMFFGISAGAVVTSILGAGYSVDEFMAALAGYSGGRIPPVDLSLMKLGHVNTEDMKRRVGAAMRATAWAFRDAAVRQELPSVDQLFLEYASLVGPPFKTDEFERILRDILELPGSTNDFRNLQTPVYIGASDQDARKHVLFGSEKWSDIPISQAVQASMSVHPAFSAVRINGRYYEDGAVTRTSDFVEAIERGSDLIVVIDPFVPYVSKSPGQVSKRGVLYNIDQDIRSLSYTRFENTRNWILRKHPDVSSYTFLPSNTLRRILSMNPMDHRPFLEIWKGAYLSTFKRIGLLAHRMRGDFHAHGIEIDLRKAFEVSNRLKRTPYPKFEDFFPDRRIVIKRPPLALEGKRR